LCATPDDKGRANRERERADAFRHGLLVVESKRWERPLDRAAGVGGGRAAAGDEREVPSSQMLRYLSRAETVSERRVQWGVLTNGRLWRLYWQAAKSRSEEYLELDLALIMGVRQDLLGPPEDERDHWLVVLALLFGRAGHAEEVVPGRNFVRVALDEGRLFEEELTGELDEVVFGTVFKDLVEALERADPARVRPATPAYLAELKTAALTLLYRLLFVL
jgi:hypothetical protein